MRRRVGLILGWAILSLALPGVVRAGMPTFTAADLGRSFHRALAAPTVARLEAISFFLLGLLVCTAIVRAIWNLVQRDFSWLPRLSFGKALGVVVLWGLLFVLVLTMISGARELMTPGAWEKTGLTYRLSDSSRAVEQQITQRYQAIERLSEALYAYARSHGGSFPPVAAAESIPDRLWTMPGPSGQRYVYLGGRLPDEDDFTVKATVLAYEPDAVGDDRLVLMTDGWIVWMPVSQIGPAAGRKP